MLLTSSQVSVAVSSFVVFVFTSALFLSGYALQQQTVRDLRAVIKPQLARPTPALYLPPQFRDEAMGLVPAAVKEGEWIEDRGNIDDGAVYHAVAEDSAIHDLEENEKVINSGRRKGSAKKERLTQSDGKKAQQPMVEQRREKEEIPAQNAESDEGKLVGEAKPLSRAARRKKIKEEILATGEGDGFKGYKRRMW